ncbi:MAG: monofunctional biosynthetic peptidoglycan transglycosylase, partial [Betaproteobacteria bacterium]|nr:monofunctional biosynthetic peptidoglycan transglycosylase [Betaproteobacteria bacterium]
MRSWVSVPGRVGYWLRKALLAGFLLLLLWQAWIFAQVLWWRTHNPDSTSFMRLRAAARQEAGRGALLPHPWVPYERVP